MTQLIIGIIAIIIALFIIKKVVGCVARIVVIIILCAILSILYATHANAQLFKPKKKAQESYTVTQDGQIKKRALFEKKPKAERVIDPKYLAGACPEVNGKIQWQKAIESANMVLGSSPSTMLRDWSVQAGMTQTYAAISQHYVDATLNCNLLLHTAYSNMGLGFGPYSVNSRYSHGAYLAGNEDGKALPALWGSTQNGYYMAMKTYSATNLDKSIFWKLPYLFEYTDPVAGIGYRHTVYPGLTSDETLLSRAEAYINLGQYDKACADMTLWVRNISKDAANDGIVRVFHPHPFGYWLGLTDFDFEMWRGLPALGQRAGIGFVLQYTQYGSC